MTTRRIRLRAVVIAVSLFGAGGAVAKPVTGAHMPWTSGPTFYGGASSTFTWTQLSVATTAVGNSNEINGATGPTTVNQTSGPVFAFGTYPSSGAPGSGGSTAAGGATVTQGASGLINIGPGASGGLVNVNTSGTKIAPTTVSTGAAGQSTGTPTGGGVTIGVGVSTPTTTGLGATASLTGASSPSGVSSAGVGATVGLGVSTAGSAGLGGSAATPSASLGIGASVGAGLNVNTPTVSTGGANAGVQVCTTCLTGGVGG